MGIIDMQLGNDLFTCWDCSNAVCDAQCQPPSEMNTSILKNCIKGTIKEVPCPTPTSFL